jgi:hypothetical protein
VVYDFWEEDSNRCMGSLCRKLRKKRQEVLRGEKKEEEHFE